MRLTAGFFPLSRRCRSFHLVSVFYKGKKDITSDALLRIYDSVSNLRYRNPAFLSPPALRDTSPYHKGRHDWWVRHPLTIGLILTHDSLPLHDWWVRHPLTIGEAWGGVPPPLTIRRGKGAKTQGRQCIAQYIRVSPK